MINKHIQNLFLAGAILEILHMPLELWFFGLDHSVYKDAKNVFDFIQNKLGSFAANSDESFIFLVGLFGICWLFTTYLMLRGKKCQLIIVILFSMLFISEIHHFVRSIMQMSYYPGTLIGLVICILGIILFKESLKSLRNK
jgi:dolichyl-phosphate-mannose--protein O-mannosyl transferase